MANWELTLKKIYLDQMRNGKKRLEVRVGYSKIKRIAAGDSIVFLSRDDEYQAHVKAVRNYKSFSEMLDVEDAGQIVPGKSKREVEKALKAIFPPNREAFGVYVFELD